MPSFVQTLLTLVVYGVLAVVVLKLYLAMRRKAKEAKQRWREQRWRRRIGLLLFFGPAIAWLLAFITPQPLMPLVDALRIFSRALERILQHVLGMAGDNLGPVWKVLLYPLVSCAIYTGAGILIGWPIDLLAKLRADRDGSEAGEEGLTAEPAESPEGSPETLPPPQESP